MRTQIQPVPDFRSIAVYVVLHGQTEDNVAGRWTGCNDSPLTQIGREQARKSGRILKKIGGDLSRLDFVASPLHRACTTMELLREEAGLPPLAYRTDHRLMENHCGDWTSLTPEEIRLLDAEHLERRNGDEWNWAAPGGQSAAAQYESVCAFLNTLRRDSVLVTHGLTSRLIRARLLELSPSSAMVYEFFARATVARFSAGEHIFDTEV